MATNTKGQSADSIANESWTSLGQCHFGGENEEATTLAVHADGSGWISVCDQHKDDAKKEGYEPER